MTAVLIASVAALALGASAGASGGDIAIDNAAAAPYTYDHATGGGAYNDGTIGTNEDVVESLEGGDFACGEIVSYFNTFTVAAAPEDANQTAEVALDFLANTTGQPGAAHADVVGVAVNYGSVENGGGGGAGTFGTDTGISDDGGSTASIVSEVFEPAGATLFAGATNLVLTYRVDDLEAGEQVVVRIDVRLACDPGSGPTGNLQEEIRTAQVVSPITDTINAGNQTIPFKQIGDLAGAGEPLLVVEKTVTTAGGTCPGVETLTVTAGDTVKYCYVLSNPGTQPLYDVALVDDNGTPADSSDDFTVSLSGLADLDGQGDLGDLAGGGTATGEALVTLGDAGTVVNTATGQGNNGLSGGNYAELTVSDTASVTVEGVPLPDISVEKTASPSSLPEPGGEVAFTFTVTNEGPAVTLESLIDDTFGDLNGKGTCLVPQPLAVGGSYSCSVTMTISGQPGQHTNVVTAVASDEGGNSDSAEDDETVTIADVPSSIEVVKEASPTTVNEPGGNVSFTFTVKNTSLVDAVTVNSLADSIYGDLNGQGTCSAPQTIAAGNSYSCSFTAFVSGDPGDSETNVVTASGVDDDGNPVSDDDDATVTIADVPSSIEMVKVASPSSVIFTGGNVTFTFTVKNTSLVDAVTINSLTDSIYGDLNGQGTCSLPQTIAAGGSYSCSITVIVSGDPGGSETNVAIASGVDDDGISLSDDDDAIVTLFWRGRTPGYWKNRVAEWPRAYQPGMLVQNVFAIPVCLKNKAGNLDLVKPAGADTLLEALGYKGGDTASGKAEILLRAAVAAILNEAKFDAAYPPYASTAELIAAVNAALATCDGAAMIELAKVLDGWNNGVH